MKREPKSFANQTAQALLGGALAALLAGCCTPREKPAQERAWLGGEYRQARKRPPALAANPKGGVWLIALNTNTPAGAAGLQVGDLILALDHQPVGRLLDFRRKLDHCEPGARLPVTAFHDGQTVDYTVTLGREKFRKNGNLMIAIPFIAHEWQLTPTDNRGGFSWVALGYLSNRGLRPELPTEKIKYPEGFPVPDKSNNEKFEMWLGLLQLSESEKILSQEKVPPRTGG